MKRLISLILSVLLVASAIPLVFADGAAAPIPADQAAPEAAETASPDPADPARDAAAALPEAGPAPTPLDGAVRANLNTRSAVEKEAANPAAALHFADIRTVIMKYNLNIRTLRNSLTELRDVSASDLYNAIDKLRDTQRQLNVSLQDAISGARENAPDGEGGVSDLYRIYNDLAAALGASQGLMSAQITSLESQALNIDNTVETQTNNINHAMNQIVTGGETLYLAIASMEAAEAGVLRALDTLDRAVAITEKRVERGMASAYELETMNYQRSQARSGLETLRFNIRTNKITLENMCGMATNGAVELDTITAPSPEELGKVSYDNDLRQAAARNVDVKNAVARQNNGDGADADRAYEAATDAFAAAFKVVCLTVPEKARLTDAAQETVDYQQRTFEIAAKKYELGSSSYEDYLAAQESLQSAGDDLAAAQRDLFSAYRAYLWATQYGIV